MKNLKHTTFGVIGLGRFGTALAKSLAKAGKEVIVVDCNESKVRELRHYTEHAFVAEDLTKETLEDIGIQNCDTVIICIGERIDTSILTTLNVVGLGVPRVIAKAISRDQGAVLEKTRGGGCLPGTGHGVEAGETAGIPIIFWTTSRWTTRWKYSRFLSHQKWPESLCRNLIYGSGTV